MIQPEQSLFPLGIIEVTPEATRKLCPAGIREAISRHRRGDWGEVDSETRNENNGGIGYARLAICSRYRDANGTTFWIMTQPERRQTIVMLGSIEESPSYS